MSGPALTEATISYGTIRVSVVASWAAIIDRFLSTLGNHERSIAETADRLNPGGIYPENKMSALGVLGSVTFHTKDLDISGIGGQVRSIYKTLNVMRLQVFRASTFGAKAVGPYLAASKRVDRSGSSLGSAPLPIWMGRAGIPTFSGLAKTNVGTVLGRRFSIRSWPKFCSAPLAPPGCVFVLFARRWLDSGMTPMRAKSAYRRWRSVINSSAILARSLGHGRCAVPSQTNRS